MSNKKPQHSIDVKLIQRIQGGDLESFETLYKNYYKYVYYICYEYFRDYSKAEDVTQETFIKVYKGIGKLTTPETFIVWINRIAYNCCHSAYRKSSRDAIGNTVQSESDNFIENISLEEKNPDYTSLLEIERAKEIITVTLEKMKPEIRIIGYLYFFEQLSYKEITIITDKSMGTVSSSIKRIKEKLKEQLTKHHIEKECYMSILLLPNIMSIYQDFVKTIEVPSTPTFIVENATFNSMPPKSNSWVHISRIALVCMTIAVPTFVFTYKTIQMKGQSNIIGEAHIEEIKYDDTLTNKNVSVNVTTSTSKYDKILLDGQEDLSLHKNGVHIIELIYNENIIDSKEFVVNNIDKKVPDIIKTEINGQVKLKFEDEHEINYSSFQIYINGQVSKEYMFDDTDQSVSVPKNIHKNITISIQDIVGNQLDADIKFFEITN